MPFLGILQPPLARLAAGVYHALAILSKTLRALGQKILRRPEPGGIDVALDAIYSLDPEDIVSAEHLRQLCLDRIWLGENFQDPQFTYFVGQETYKRYRNGGTLEDLLASTLFAKETLDLLGGNSPVPSPSGSRPSPNGNRGSSDATPAQGDVHPEASDAPNSGRSHNHGRASASRQEPDLKAKAALAFVDRMACIFEWDKTHKNYFEAVPAAVHAIELAAEAAPLVKALTLDVLGTVYEVKWQKGHILGDLCNSIEASSLAMECGDPSNQHWPIMVDNYAGHLDLRYDVTHDVKEINEAIRLSTEVYGRAATANGRARAAVNLSAKLQARARDNDITQAVEFLRIALQLTPPGLPERWSRLRNLSLALIARAEITHNSQDFVHAISYAREALAAVDSQSPSREKLLTDLAYVLERHYREIEDPKERSLDEINESIRWTKEAKIMYEHEDHRGDSLHQIYRWNTLVATLSRRIYLKYEQTQNPDDAGEARLAGAMLHGLKRPGPQGVGETDGQQSDEVEESHATGDTGESPTEQEHTGETSPFDPLRVTFRHRPNDFTHLGNFNHVHFDAGFAYWLENPS